MKLSEALSSIAIREIQNIEETISDQDPNDWGRNRPPPGGWSHTSSVWFWISLSVIIIAAVSILVILICFCRQKKERRTSEESMITHIELQNAVPSEDPATGPEPPVRKLQVLKGEHVIITVVEKY